MPERNKQQFIRLVAVMDTDYDIDELYEIAHEMKDQLEGHIWVGLDVPGRVLIKEVNDDA